MFREVVRRGKNSVNGNCMRQALHYDLPLIDVIVRESFQNSLDALREEAPFLDLRYNLGKFETDDFESVLDDGEYNLSRRFGSTSEFLEIRDTGTYGLDGPSEISENMESGRWIKLVYSFGDKQSELEKGGSWGYGKTCYYNLGGGFVIYYSRTVVNGEHESRLTVSLIEDTDHRENMIIPEAELGTVYWGDQSAVDRDSSAPLTDESDILKVLDIFGIEPFHEDETGTSIIIPFVNPDQLSRETLERMYDDELPSRDRYDFESLVFLAVQRWYFPRLLECPEDQKPVRFWFNGKLLSYNMMENVFVEMKRLYDGTFDDDCRKVGVRDNIKGGSAEPVAFVSVGSGMLSDLSLPSDMNLSQMLLCEGTNNPNVFEMRCRKIGMIVDYESDSVLIRNTVIDSDQYLFVMLRINPDAVVTDRTGNPVVNLDEYVRKGEPPSHDSWMDVDLSLFDPKIDKFRPRIIENLFKNIKQQISNQYKTKSSHEKGRRIGMSKAVGRLLFPDGLFDPARPRTYNPTGGGATRSSRTGFSSENEVTYTSDGINLSCRFVLGKNVHSFSLQISPNITGEKIDSLTEWEEKTGYAFPYIAKSYALTSINGKVIEPPFLISSEETTYGDATFHPLKHGVGGVVDEILIVKNDAPLEMEVSIDVEREESATFPLQIRLTERDDVN